MAAAARYFGISLTLAGLFCSSALAQKSWEQRAKEYFFGPETHGTPQDLTSQEAARGLGITLRICIDYAALKLGHYDGFAAAPSARIPLPPDFQKARKLLGHFGLAARLDDLELEMNRAAEEAMPDLVPVIDQAIGELVFDDTSIIVAGPDNAATLYFKSRAEAKLKETIRPIIEKSLKDSGAQNSLKIINHSLHSLPMAPNLNFDMTAYVSEKTLDSVYLYMALKEKDIRERPSLTRNEIITRLFRHR